LFEMVDGGVPHEKEGEMGKKGLEKKSCFDQAVPNAEDGAKSAGAKRCGQKSRVLACFPPNMQIVTPDRDKATRRRLSREKNKIKIWCRYREKKMDRSWQLVPFAAMHPCPGAKNTSQGWY
jgi:hypothetical protein